MTKMTNRLLRCLALAACLLLAAVAQAETVKLPSRPDPPRLVNDLAGVLGDTQALEDTLEAFSNATSNQILVVTVTDLQDLEPWDYAVQLGRAWGVGGKKHNNGVVILIKPKNDTPGRVTIQVGYGLEGALPDAFCSKIIEREMKPRFIAGDYLGGVWNAVRVIMPTAKGEYNEEAYDNDQNGNGGEIAAVVIIAFVIIFVWAMSRTGRGRGRNDRHLGRPHHLLRRRRRRLRGWQWLQWRRGLWRFRRRQLRRRRSLGLLVAAAQAHRHHYSLTCAQAPAEGGIAARRRPMPARRFSPAAAHDTQIADYEDHE